MTFSPRGATAEERARSWPMRLIGIPIAMASSPSAGIGMRRPVNALFTPKETDFDAARAVTPAEYEGVLRDLDVVAEQLKLLQAAHAGAVATIA